MQVLIFAGLLVAVVVVPLAAERATAWFFITRRGMLNPECPYSVLWFLGLITVMIMAVVLRVVVYFLCGAWHFAGSLI